MSRPRQITVWPRGVPYAMDLLRCRRAMVDRQIAGDLDSMESLAEAVGVSRSTASRFFSGKPTSLSVTLRILSALKLQFEDVARPELEDDDPKGRSGLGAKLPADKPRNGAGQAAIHRRATEG